MKNKYLDFIKIYLVLYIDIIMDILDTVNKFDEARTEITKNMVDDVINKAVKISEPTSTSNPDPAIVTNDGGRRRSKRTRKTKRRKSHKPHKKSKKHANTTPKRKNRRSIRRRRR